MAEPTLYEKSVPGRTGVNLPELEVPEAPLPENLLRSDNKLPELSQLDVTRHYHRLSKNNYGVDSGFYPLGSCTMKYNPKTGEAVARLPGFTAVHPLLPEADVQGNLCLMFNLQECLKEIGGFDAVSLQPSAGAHGELAGLLMIRAYNADRGEHNRNQILIPDSAHGTNPASTTMAGLEVVEIPTNGSGDIDLDALRAACGPQTAGLMLTNPNTLGLFEEQIVEVIEAVHDCGGFVYGDGANMNALTAIVRPGDFGIDIMHFNLHKTFGTPHGGGGPGSGPIGASKKLATYLPGPIVSNQIGKATETGVYSLKLPEKSIGPVSGFYGNFTMFVRAYGYILIHGAAGLKANAEHAVLNANYLRVALREFYPVPYDRICMHEFVCQGLIGETGIRAVDISKRLMDFGFHPPTNYFPLIVREALMIEPTETESRQTLDRFVKALVQIAHEAEENPDFVRGAPYSTPVKRLDEVRAAREQIFSEHLET